MRHLYPELAVPTSILAGSDDRIVSTNEHSARLHRELPFSKFHRLPDCGHMVHHAAPRVVAEAIAEIEQHRQDAAAALRAAAASPRPSRQWLQIDQGLVAA